MTRVWLIIACYASFAAGLVFGILFLVMFS